MKPDDYKDLAMRYAEGKTVTIWKCWNCGAVNGAVEKCVCVQCSSALEDDPKKRYKAKVDEENKVITMESEDEP